MKKEKGPLLYIGQPKFQSVQPVMQEIAKAGDAQPAPEKIPEEQPEGKLEEKPAAKKQKETEIETGRLKPFRDMNLEEKVVYLAERRIPVPCRFEWKNGSVRGIIKKYDKQSVWVADEESKETVQIPVADIVYIRIAGT